MMGRTPRFVARAAGACAGAVLAVSAALLAWRGVAPAPEIPPPDGPCVEIMVASNGFHTDLVFPAAVLPRDHPLRRLYPEARLFSVGWGDREAYRTGSEQPWRHVEALFPGPSVLHVAADPGWRGAPAAISESGAAALSAYLRAALEPNAAGEAAVVSEGLVPGRSAFVAARESFHAFNLCNHWTARALRAAGLPVSDLGAWLAEGVLRQLRHAPRCPAAAGPGGS